MLRFLKFSILFLFAIVLYACGGSESTSPKTGNVFLKDEIIADCKMKDISFNASTQWLQIEYIGQWSIATTYSGESGWCTLQTTSGTSDHTIWVNITKNNGSSARSVTFNITMGDETVALTITQKTKADATNPSGTNWLELPYCQETSNIRFLPHYTSISGKTERNFTILYDTQKMYPIWVAYPMHSKWIGSGSRSDAWAYDPTLSTSLQPNLISGMGNGYDRGHMIPSAARYVTQEANNQTFYYTNMTPQLNGFNANKWASTESYVRKRVQQSNRQDTIYVVTGAVLQTVGGNETVKYVNNRNDGKQLPVPNYYYKVLLKRVYSTSGTITFKAIGLWFDHKAASGDPKASDAKSVDWIEAKTGIDFFANLPIDIQNSIESTCNTSEWELY